MSNQPKSSKKLRVTLVKSVIGRLPKHRATVRGLGLRRTGQSVLIDDTPAMRGMVSKVSYLLRLEDGA